jgi:predicted metal-dependent phosphoesterase TrpH
MLESMRTRLEPLLAELHAHTTWSDGDLTMRELVDLYGRQGFDVLCVTDHVVRSDDPWGDDGDVEAVSQRDYPAYLAEIAVEALRARTVYGLLVLPGLELTFNDTDPTAAAHAVAVGLREYVSVDAGIEEALRTARAAGAATIAAHPYDVEPAPSASRLTLRFAREPALGELVDRYELFNRSQLFAWVAEAGLPAVATGDAHVAEHLYGWKTLLPCRRDEQAVVAYLRSRRPVYLTRLDQEHRRLAA